MFFSNPSYLFALLGLTVPLAIHLWSKKEGRVIKVGSIQFMSEEDPKKSSSIQINEIWLLVLRMLLLAVLSFILAEMFYKTTANEDTRAMFIDPHLKDNAAVARVIDSLEAQQYQLYWFTIGFPAFNDKPDTSLSIPYWQLANELNTFPAQNIQIISNARLASVMGKRPEIKPSISWITISNPATSEFLVEATPDENQLHLIKAYSNQHVIKFKKAIVNNNEKEVQLSEDSVVIDGSNIVKLTQDTIFVAFQVDEHYSVDSIYVRTAFETICDYTHWPIQLDHTAEEKADWLIWLSDQPVVSNAKYQLILRPDSLANKLIEPTDQPGTYRLTARLDESSIINQDFITGLLFMLRAEIGHYETLVNSKDERLIDDSQLMPGYVLSDSVFTINQSVNGYLWVVLVLLFLGERFLAFFRNQ